MPFETGALKDQPDSRDYPFAESRIAKAAAGLTLPPSVSLAHLAGPVKNQNGTGACLAFVCASAREWLVRSLDYHSQVIYSPLYLYYRTRQIMGTLGQDSGSYPRDAMKALAHWGIPEEIAWPFSIDALHQEPNSLSDTIARPKRIYSYHRLEIFSIAEMKTCLAEGHPFILSMEVFGNLNTLPLENGIAQMPEDLPTAGGHAILALGYHEDSACFHCQNSWGENWGLNGRFWLPYEYAQKYGWDAWVMVA